jgi:carbamoyl-phosphate synthase large subunit
MSSDAIPVVVTGVGGGGFGEQILKALRIAPTRYEIIGTDVTPLSKGFATVDHRYVVPRATDQRYVEIIRGICNRHRARALFAGSEPEIRSLGQNRSLFEDEGILLPLQPQLVLDTCFDKVQTARFLESQGFVVPRTVRIADISQLDAVDFFPAVIKPSVGAGGSSDVVIAQDHDELLSFGQTLLANGRHLLAQEYVGTPDAEFTVGVLSSMSGEFIQSIALKRFTSSALGSRLKVPNRTGRKDLGAVLVISSGISQGEIGPFPEVTEPCERIGAALGSRGALNVQCRLVDNSVVVFEINPRFSGTTSLRAMVGFNEPDVLVREHVLGAPVTRRFSYASGVILRGLEESLMTADTLSKVTDLR